MLTDFNDAYVETRGDQVYVRDSRVPLEHIILLWKRGENPEAIHDDFPSLSLAAIYGTIAYYLSHQEALDQLISSHKQQYAAQRATLESSKPEWHASMRARIADARERLENAGKLESTDLSPTP